MRRSLCIGMKNALAIAVLGGSAGLIIGATGCATTPGIWHRAGTTEEATSADVAACKGTAWEIGYRGVTVLDYVTRCMEAKGYQPSL